MNVLKSLNLRMSRGFSISAMGPNEARVLYDLMASVGGAFVASLLGWWTATAAPAPIFLSLPFAFVAANGALGVYTRHRHSGGSRKATILVVACGLVATAYGLMQGVWPTVVLWFALTAPSVALPRLLLNLRLDRRRNLAHIAVNRGGPVLVVGGAGYIGCHVVHQLLQRGEQVRVLDRFMYSRSSIASFEDSDRFEVIEGDATDIARLAEAMQGVSSVVHLAGLVGDPACAVDPDFTRHTNIITTRMVKEIAQSLGVYRFVFASSCSVYGVSEEEVTEEAVLNPVSLYAQTKIDSERELLSTARDDFFVSVLRFATVFGHSWRPRFDLVGNLFAAQAMTDGVITVVGPDQWRPFIHVRDLARAVVAVLEAPPYTMQGQVYNVGDRRLNRTILQLAQTVKAVVESMGASVEITVRESEDDRRNYAVCFDKIHRVLGFEAETLLEDGIREIAREFQKGTYGNFRDSIYSNVAIAKQAVEDFRDPLQAAHLYAPLSRES